MYLVKGEMRTMGQSGDKAKLHYDRVQHSRHWTSLHFTTLDTNTGSCLPNVTINHGKKEGKKKFSNSLLFLCVRFICGEFILTQLVT